MKTLRQFLLLALVAFFACFCFAKGAQAHTRHHREARWTLDAQYLPKHKKRKHVDPVTPATPPPAPMLMGMGDVGSLGCVNLPMGTIVRVVVGYYDSAQRNYACAIAAVHAGYKLDLTIQWSDQWTVPQTQQRFRDVLSLYAPLHPFAVAIGNEQELQVTGGWKSLTQTAGQLAGAYDQMWRAVEPIVAQAVPSATRVAGEISPWGLSYLQDVIADGLPGVQAYGAHVYPAQDGLNPESVAQLAYAHHVQAWATEGMCGPGYWRGGSCIPAEELQHEGYSVGLEWYATAPAPAPPNQT